MGGRVGLKGSDGAAILCKARELGAQPESLRRAVEALEVVSRLKDDIDVITYPHEMGEEETRACGFSPTVIGSITTGETTLENTQQAAQDMMEMGVELILFAGGDGTARDIYNAVGQSITTLGIPAGVKMYSGVYAVTPRHAGEAAAMFMEGKLLNLRDGEVMDIDEDACREGIVTAELYGYLLIPEERRFVQRVKSGSARGEKEALLGIAAEIIINLDEDTLYIIGPGTTTRTIMDELGLDNTLLGVDVVQNKRLVANDVNERDLLDLIEQRRAKIVVTVIGGQGYIFGRGNQQISPNVIRKVGKENIIIVAAGEKLLSLERRPLLVDTGEEDLNQMLSGYVKVTSGFKEFYMYKISS